MVMHATSVTATTRVLSMSSDSAVTHGHVTAHTSSLPQPCYLYINEKCVNLCLKKGCSDATHLPFYLADRFNNNFA